MQISFDKAWQISKNKSFEIQFEFNRRWNDFNVDLFNFKFKVNRKGDHAGLDVTFELFEKLFLNIHLYDIRHWDYDNNKWCTYSDSEEIEL